MKLQLLRDYSIIKHTSFFDEAYYLRMNKDVRLADVDPLWHFVINGWKEGRNPNQYFDIFFYLSNNEDVKGSGINPLVHYIKYGMSEGRLTINNDNNNTIENENIYFSRLNSNLNDQSIKNTSVHNQKSNLIQKTIISVQKKGIKATFKKMREYIFLKVTETDQTSVIDGSNNLTDREIEAQRRTEFKKKVKFSIIVPLYNTPVEFLTELIHSVVNQTYSNWELCIADGSDKKNEIIEKTMRHWKGVPNICYKNLNGNKGIALNTVAAYEMATGDFIVLMDHDDILTVDALYELAKTINNFSDCDILYSDRAIFSSETKKILAYHYLPGYSPDYLRSMNYMSHIIAYSRNILHRVGFENPGYEGSQDYELLLRSTEVTDRIYHIPKVLYYCRATPGSVALNPDSKLYAYDAGKKALIEHLDRIGYPGKVEFLRDLYAYRIHYQIKLPKISIIIPNKDHVNDLKRCLNSLISRSTYKNYEIAIVENNSIEESTFSYYSFLEKDPRIKILVASVEEFNYSKLNNFAVNNTDGDFVLLLNNDTEVITPSWIEEMLMFAQRQDVGAVGAKLLYPNDKIQHCGLVIGLGGGVANNFGQNKSNEETGYMNSLVLPQNYSAVTAACLLVKRNNYLQVGGMDESNFVVALNDVDFCLKLREIGLYNVWTPYAQLYHFESSTRGSDENGDNLSRYKAECSRFKNKWRKYFEFGDPFQRKNFNGW